MKALSSTLPERMRLVLPAAATTAALLLTGCGAPAAPPSNAAGGASGTAAARAADLYGHVHGISADPQNGRVLLATHHGLFEAAGPADPLGPVIDLMGFSAAGHGQYYASGHPGPGSDLPDPVGLIRSSDGGGTWEQLSRQGESDFHALAVTRSGVVGFDGQLQTTSDFKTWQTVDAGFQPYNLAGTPTSDTVLATTEQGVYRSEDGGLTWSSVEDAPLLLLTAFADDSTVVGISPEGVVFSSSDAGESWERMGKASGQPHAMTAEIGQGNRLLVWVHTAKGLKHSDDGGKTFAPYGT
jgi:hypothetical protein